MRSSFSSSGQLFLVMHYLLGSALSEYRPLVTDLLPKQRQPHAWEAIVSEALLQVRALERSVYDAEPSTAFDDNSFDAALDDHHDQWDQSAIIRDLNGTGFGMADSEFAFWAYAYWLSAILVEYFDVLGSPEIADSLYGDLYDALRSQHRDSLAQLKHALEAAISTHAGLPQVAADYLHQQGSTWAVQWRHVVVQMAEIPFA